MKSDNEKNKKVQSFLEENAGSHLQRSDFAEQVADTIYGRNFSFKKFLFCGKDALVTFDRVKWLVTGIFLLAIPIILSLASLRIAENYHIIFISVIIGFVLLALFDRVWMKIALEVSQKQQRWYQSWRIESQEAPSEVASITSRLQEYGLTERDFQLAMPCVQRGIEGGCIRRILVRFPSLKMEGDTWSVVATVM